MAAQKDLPEDKDLRNGGALEEAPKPELRRAARPRSLPARPGTVPSIERSAIVHAQLEFSGPLPPPQILGQYEDELPGAAERLFRMAEKQQDHRINMDESSVRRANWGLGAGFAVAV